MRAQDAADENDDARAVFVDEPAFDRHQPGLEQHEQGEAPIGSTRDPIRISSGCRGRRTSSRIGSWRSSPLRRHRSPGASSELLGIADTRGHVGAVVCLDHLRHSSSREHAFVGLCWTDQRNRMRHIVVCVMPDRKRLFGCRVCSKSICREMFRTNAIAKRPGRIRKMAPESGPLVQSISGPKVASRYRADLKNRLFSVPYSAEVGLVAIADRDARARGQPGGVDGGQKAADQGCWRVGGRLEASLGHFCPLFW